MTTSEQQAVPVAQEDEARKVLAAEMLDNHAASTFLAGKDRLISTRAALRAMHRFASLPCKSGEGAEAVKVTKADRDLFALIRPDMASLIYGGDLDTFPQMQGIVRHRLSAPDATQTREAEGRSIYAECPQHGQFARCAPCCDAARAALNARGGA